MLAQAREALADYHQGTRPDERFVELSAKHREIRDKLVNLLLDEDQERATRELLRIADYRNYRRYEIFNESDSGGRIRLSEWGTGSGGQAVRAAVGMPERVKSAVELWRAAVNEHLQATDAVKAIVSGYCIELPGRSAQEVVERLNGLRALAQSPLLLREVSAQLFWGMSKVLDNRQALVAAILGVSTCPFPESPVQLLVKLPAGPLSGVLFIENQMSFEQASRAASPAMEGLALAFAAGFRGSARRLRSEKGSSLYYAASSQASEHARQQFEGWLYGESAVQPVYFWGDLDWSGMRILRALRQTFENAQAWVTGYRPMLQALQSGQGHAPLEADKQGQASLRTRMPLKPP